VITPYKKLNNLSHKNNYDKMSETKETSKKDYSDFASLTEYELYSYIWHCMDEDVYKLKKFLEEKDNIKNRLHLAFLHMRRIKDGAYPIKETFEEGCKQNIGIAFNNLGHYYFEYDNAKEYTKAKELFEEGCKRNIPISFVNLAMIYKYGDGIEKDSKKAIELLQKGCEIKCVDAFNGLANLYFHGNGVEVNIDKARELYREGIKLGGFSAFINLYNINMDDKYMQEDMDELASFAHRHKILNLKRISENEMKLLRIIHEKNMQNAELKQIMSIAMSKGQANFVITQSALYLP
jgi:TPR repeat protein